MASITFDSDAADQADETCSSETVGRHAVSTAGGTATGDANHESGLPVGSKFGRFELRSVLGQGTYGKVFRAFDPVLDREIALKVPKFGSDGKTLVERFLREAKAAARLRHPNIVGVFESGRVVDNTYIASEFVDGDTLAAAIKQGPIEPIQAAEWCRALADGLAYAHSSGVIHRDIKPGNVLLEKTGRPRIADFGLAKRIDEDATMTTEGSLLGTPAYMSPEQARGQTDKIGPASDQYSLGAILYELLTGRRPYEGSAHVVIAKVAGNDPPSPPRSIRPSIPRDLEAICMRCLEKDPSRRYGDVQQLAQDLERWLAGRPVTARWIGPLGRLMRWSRRNPVLSTSLAVTAAVILAAVGGAFTRVVIRLEKAEQAAIAAEQEVLTAKKSVEVENASAQAANRLVAINEFERGRNLCERGELTQGLLWLANSLGQLTPQTSDLDRPIRSYIASWLPHIHKLKLVIPHDQNVNSVAYSNDDKWIASGSGRQGVGRAQIWDRQTGAPIGPAIEHAGSVMQVSFSPDGALLATASLDRTTRIIQPVTGKIVHSLAHPDAVWSAAFNADGTRLATGCADGFARVWDLKTAETVGPLFQHPQAPNGEKPVVQRVVFSPDGKTLLTSTGDRRLRIWNVSTGEVVAGPLYGPGSVSYAVDYHPDGHKVLAQIEINGTVGAQFRDLKTLSPIGPEFGHKTRLMSAYCSSDGRYVLTGGRTQAQIWDAQTGASIGQAMLHNLDAGEVVGSYDASGISDAHFSHDLKTVATAGFDRVVRVWDVSWKSINGRLFEHNVGTRARFQPKGQIFASGDGTRPNTEPPAPNRIRFWNAETGELVAGPHVHNGGMMLALAFSSDGTIYARANNNLVELRRSDNGSAIREAIGYPTAVIALAFSPDDSIVVAGCGDGVVRFWSRETAGFVEPSLKHEKTISEVTFSPDGTLLLTSSLDGSARMWNWPGRTQVGAPMRHPLAVRFATFHPNGKMVATAGDDGTVRFWNVPDGTPLPGLIPNLEEARSVKFTPDGTAVITMNHAGIAQLWDYATRLPAARPFDHDGTVVRLSLDISRDGRFILTAGRNPAVRLWETPQPVSGSPQQLKARIERLLGAKIGEDQRVRVLDSAEWKARENQ